MTLAKRVRSKVGLTTALLTAAMVSADAPNFYQSPERSRDVWAQVLARVPKSQFDGHPDFFVHHHRGEFTTEERRERIEQVAPGITIFHDVGLDFYRVLPGEDLIKIRKKLSALPEYGYLEKQLFKEESFNIRPRSVEAGMWLPIPLENKDRHLSDEQFARNCDQAINAILKNERYGEMVKHILEKVSREQLIADMVASAKQESGGRPLGQFEFERWEPHHHCYSFSAFHVLMTGPGLSARRNLAMTEGQLYNPQNGAELYLAFLYEKARETRKNPANFFPLTGERLLEFAKFYNGSTWRKTNPHYVEHMIFFREHALAMLEALKRGEQPPAMPPLPHHAEPAVSQHEHHIHRQKNNHHPEHSHRHEHHHKHHLIRHKRYSPGEHSHRHHHPRHHR